MSSSDISIHQDGALLRIVFTRPAKRNAINVAMYAAMADALEQAASDDEIRVILFAGDGPMFCAGNDLVDFMANPPTSEHAPVFRFLRALATSPAILIAAVEGLAVGIGTTMLLHCDFVVAAQSAVLHMPFVDLAVVPEAGSSLLLPQMIGYQRAARLLLLGEKLPAPAAWQQGLISELSADGEALGTAEALSLRLLAKPAGALRDSKRLMRSGQEQILAHIATEAQCFGARLGSEEFVANVRAFLTR